MSGRGVTNYSTSKPSCGFSTSTTEFDDALLSRGIITFEQAMLAKGASAEEALRLTALKHSSSNNIEAARKTHMTSSNSDDGDFPNDDHVTSNSDSSDEEEDDKRFLENYRKMRVSQLKEEMAQTKGTAKLFGQVIPINRTDWNHEVNDASEDGTWVVIHLTAQNSSPASHPLHMDICQLMENEVIPELARKFLEVKFVTIPSTSAIPNWPENNLPTIFCYRYGKLQHQLVGLEDVGGVCLNTERVEWRLARLGVVETELQSDPKSTLSHTSSFDEAVNMKNGMSRFGGRMATLATQRNDDESDYDDVD